MEFSNLISHYIRCADIIPSSIELKIRNVLKTDPIYVLQTILIFSIGI